MFWLPMIQVVPHLVVHLQKKLGCHLAPALAHAVPGQEEVVAHVLARDACEAACFNESS